MSQKNHHFRERFFSETGAGKHVPRCVMVDLEFGPEKVEQLTGSDGYSLLPVAVSKVTTLWNQLNFS